MPSESLEPDYRLVDPDKVADEFGIKSLGVVDGVPTLTTEPTSEQARALVLEMSLALGKMLDDDQAPNYVEFEVSPAGHPGYVVHVRRAIGQTPHALRKKAEARVAELEARLVEVEQERDLAIAHDRQPYPTAWAYEQACAALEKHRKRADTAEARIAELEATRPRVIERAEDLDVRPIGTVVRTDRGRIAEKTTDGLPSPCGRFRSGWMLTQSDEIECGTDELDDFPITVIWSPPCYRCGADHDHTDEPCAPCVQAVLGEIGGQS